MVAAKVVSGRRRRRESHCAAPSYFFAPVLHDGVSGGHSRQRWSSSARPAWRAAVSERLRLVSSEPPNLAEPVCGPARHLGRGRRCRATVSGAAPLGENACRLHRRRAYGSGTAWLMPAGRASWQNVMRSPVARRFRVDGGARLGRVWQRCRRRHAQLNQVERGAEQRGARRRVRLPRKRVRAGAERRCLPGIIETSCRRPAYDQLAEEFGQQVAKRRGLPPITARGRQAGPGFRPGDLARRSTSDSASGPTV